MCGAALPSRMSRKTPLTRGAAAREYKSVNSDGGAEPRLTSGGKAGSRVPGQSRSLC